MNLDQIIAIDFHTHAEEPCCGPRDDGYHEFQAGMAKYFRNPAGAHGMLAGMALLALSLVVSAFLRWQAVSQVLAAFRKHGGSPMGVAPAIIPLGRDEEPGADEFPVVPVSEGGRVTRQVLLDRRQQLVGHDGAFELLVELGRPQRQG